MAVLRDFRLTPPPAAVHPRQYPIATAVIPPLKQQGEPVRRCRATSTPTRALAGRPAPPHRHARRRHTDRAGGTSLYRFAAFLPRTGHGRGRSRPEESIPPDPPGGSQPPHLLAWLRPTRSRAPAVRSLPRSASTAFRLRSLAHSLRGPVHSHGCARQRPASRPAGMVWQACRGQSRASPTLGLAKAPSRQPGPEDSIPPPAPRRGEWCLAGFPCQALSGLGRPFQREACLHGTALITPPRPPHGGSCPRGRLRRYAPSPAAWHTSATPRRHRPAARKAGSFAPLRSPAFRLPAIRATRSSALGSVRYPPRSPGRVPTTHAAWLGQRLGGCPSGLVWPACPVLAGSPAPPHPSARRPGPQELIPPCPPRGEVVGSPLQASLPRFALLAPVPPAFGRSFAPPPLRSGSAPSLTHSGVPSTRTATRPRSRRGRASCPRDAGIPARAGASLAGLLP